METSPLERSRGPEGELRCKGALLERMRDGDSRLAICHSAYLYSVLLSSLTSNLNSQFSWLRIMRKDYRVQSFA